MRKWFNINDNKHYYDKACYYCDGYGLVVGGHNETYNCPSCHGFGYHSIELIEPNVILRELVNA